MDMDLAIREVVGYLREQGVEVDKQRGDCAPLVHVIARAIKVSMNEGRFDKPSCGHYRAILKHQGLHARGLEDMRA